MAKAPATTTPASADDFFSTLGTKAPPAESATQAAPPATTATPDDFFSTLGGDAPATRTAPATTGGQSGQPPPPDGGYWSPPAAGQSIGGVIGRAAQQGFHQALDVPAEALGGATDWVARQFGYKTNQLQRAQQESAAWNDPYNADPANQNLGPRVANFGGNALATLPAALAAGGGIGAAAKIGFEALPTVAGWAAPAVNALARYVPSILGGAGAGAAVSAQTGEPIGEGAAIGGVLGGAGPIAKDLGNALFASRNPAVAQAVEGHGIPLRLGQVAKNKMMRYLDDITAPESSDAAQRTAVTTDAARSMGVTPELAAANGLKPGEIVPDTMALARRINGGAMNAFESKTTIQGKQALDLVTTLNTIASDASKTPSAFGDIKAHIKDVVDSIAANGGTLPGKVYGDLVAHGTPLDLATHADNSVVKEYAGRIKEALQDALHASAATPEDAAAYAQARLQYKNMMTIAPLVNKGIPGQISPLLLQGAANRSFKSSAFRGAGQLGSLGDVAQQFLRAPAQSGTEPREFWRAILQGNPLIATRAGWSKFVGNLFQSYLGRNPMTPLGAVQPGTVSPLLPSVVQNRDQLQYQPPP